MASKLATLWNEDESGQAREKTKKEEENFLAQDLIWEARLLRDECDDFRSSLEKHIACLDERITRLCDIGDRRDWELNQGPEDPQER